MVDGSLPKVEMNKEEHQVDLSPDAKFVITVSPTEYSVAQLSPEMKERLKNLYGEGNSDVFTRGCILITLRATNMLSVGGFSASEHSLNILAYHPDREPRSVLPLATVTSANGESTFQIPILGVREKKNSLNPDEITRHFLPSDSDEVAKIIVSPEVIAQTGPEFKIISVEYY